MSRSRCVMISSCGEPLLISFCLELLKKNSWNEIDAIYVCFNNYAEAATEAQAEFMARYINDPKIRIVYWPSQLGYGRPISKMLAVCEEDLIVLLEDDNFVVKPGVLDAEFKKIESGEFDALGSPRFSCGMEIAEALKQKYNLDYSGFGDRGPSYWPAFFYCKRSDLLRTDLDFGPHGFEKGVYYPELDHTMTETEAGDTFVWTSVQLRHMGLKIGEIPQNHSDPFDIDLYEKKEGKWAGDGPSYIHGGSLSAVKYLKGDIPNVEAEISKFEIESRVAWWKIIAEYNTPDLFDEQINWAWKDYFLDYEQGIEELIKNAQLDSQRITQKIKIYKEAVGD